MHSANRPADGSSSDYFSPRLSELLLHLRERAGWSQTDLADAIGVDQSLISRIETGATRRPRRATLAKIAEAFQQAGIPIQVQQLETAADSATVSVGDYDIDDRLLRIYDRLSTYPPDVQDAFYDALYAAFRLLEDSYEAGTNEAE